MTKEEEKQRNEAIIKMLGLQKHQLVINVKQWHWVMTAYVWIQAKGYRGNINKPPNSNDHAVWFEDEHEDQYGEGNAHEDLQTAIWLTVSDFAIEFNKKKNETNNNNELGYDLGGIGCGAGVDF